MSDGFIGIEPTKAEIREDIRKDAQIILARKQNVYENFMNSYLRIGREYVERVYVRYLDAHWEETKPNLSAEIGIIGMGHVGMAMASLYDYRHTKFYIRDPEFDREVEEQGFVHDDQNTGESWMNPAEVEEMVRKCQIIYLCLPTPQMDDGQCDTSLVKEYLEQLHGLIEKEPEHKRPIVVLKSTTIPSFFNDFLDRPFDYPYLIHAPEFMREDYMQEDVYTFPSLILGGHTGTCIRYISHLNKKTRLQLAEKDVKMVGWKEASFMKYLANTFLALKVIMFNEYYELAMVDGVSWNAIESLIESDPRLGPTHTTVFAGDHRGYGGTCFPKDTKALIEYSEDVGYPMELLSVADSLNEEYRKKKI